MIALRSCIINGHIRDPSGEADYDEIMNSDDPVAHRPRIDESADPFCFAMIKKKTVLLRPGNFGEPVGLAECAFAAPRHSVPMGFQ